MNNLRMAALKDAAAKQGLKIEAHNPGDGVRLRLFKADDPSGFWGPSNPIWTFYAPSRKQTIEQALAFIDGWAEAGRVGTSFGQDHQS